MMQLNDKDMLDEINAVFNTYETALVTNDVAQLDALFWESEQTIRFGAKENLIGYQAIKDFRAGRSPVGLSRKILDRHVSLFGNHFATTAITFLRDNEQRIGRQSQAWVRFDQGWRVVSAHVSCMDL
jgi:hypothetical protein